MNREDLMKEICWRCWWREGLNCFSETFGEVPMDEKNIFRKGFEITSEHITKCKDLEGYKGKRQVLENLFGNVPIIIMSEEADKNKGE